MPKVFGITGTDTGVGKTVVAAGLLRGAAALNLAAFGLKPVAAGCERRDGRLVSDDALALQAAASVALDYAEVNPVALEPAIAPHLAAAAAGIELTAAGLIEHCAQQANRQADLVVIEGAGGWRVPLNETETLADVFAGLGVPIVIVVGMRLGCLNHALLTAESVATAGLEIAGWVANRVDPGMEACEENIASLAARMPGRRLGTVPGLADTGSAARYLDLEALLER